MSLQKLQQNDVGERLVVVVIYLCLEFLLITTISNLENKKIQHSPKNKKLNLLNQTIDNYINEIKKIIAQLKEKVDELLEKQFKLTPTPQQTTSSQELVEKILKAFNFSALIDLLKIKTDKLIHCFEENTQQIFYKFLGDSHLSILIELADKPAFKKVKENTDKNKLSLLISAILPSGCVQKIKELFSTT